MSSHVSATTECPTESANCSPIGEWQFGLSVGLGARVNPIVDGDDIPLVLLPSISYYGENFFIENLDIGYTLVDSDQLMLNALVTPSYDRVFFERWDVGNLLVDIANPSNAALDANNPVGVGGGELNNFTELDVTEIKKRKFSLLGGLELSSEISSGLFQVSVLADLSDVHSGTEIRLAFSRAINQSGWNATLGLTWKDSKMTDYYYGVDEDEVVDNRGAYQAGSSLNPFVRIDWRQPSQDDNFWRFGVEYQKLDDAITKSSLVDKEYVLTAFVGKQYNF